MAFEADDPPPQNTFRRAVWLITESLVYARAYWGRRFFGGAIGLMADALAEGASQAFYARLPGHSQQALDSLVQVGLDRDFYRFRGETDANWLARIQAAWDDYAQGGTPQQVLHVVNQWGMAGWPTTWVALTSSALVESGSPTDFSFTLTIPFGLISPAWVPEVYGGGHVYGEAGFFYGLGASTDVAMLLYLVHKWKPSRSLGRVQIFYAPASSVTLTA